MGREIKDSEDMEKQREELRASYRSLILDVSASERPEGYRTVTDLGIRFLGAASPVQRLNPVIADVIRKSVQSEARPWQPGQTAEVLRHMESYALNLWDYPWKTEFHTITMFSGFFKIKIENRIFHPDDLLLLLGYKRVVHCFQLLQMPHRNDVGLVAFDLFLASIECIEMERVANAVKPIGIASRVVYEVRQEVTGDGRVCGDHVRERYRLVKAGRGKSTPTSGKAGEGGVGGGGGKGDGAEEELKESGEGEGGGRAEGGVVGRAECGGGGGGGRGDGSGKSIQTGLAQSNLRGLGRDGGMGSGAAGEGGVESEASYSRSVQAGSRAFPIDPKPTAAGSHGNAMMRTESWRGSGGAHPETENVYDAVEDLSRIEQSVYYGFPSSDKSKLGTLRATTTTRKEKKDVVVPPRVTGPAAAAALWGQAGATTEESNLSFSTFRQERSRSGAEFRESTSKRSSYQTIESGRQESRDRSGSQRNQSDVMSLRGRGVVRVKGQGHDAEGFGADVAAIHHHHGYAAGSDVDDDAVATLLNLSPDQMKDPVTRRQVLAQLEPITRQNAPPPPPPPPPGGSARGPSSTRLGGVNVDTCSPYQPWQFQASDLPRPPISVYLDHSQTMTLTQGRPSGSLTSGKTRDPWKSDDLDRDETWQCGSCSYENRPIDDACHVCNTSRYL